MKILMALVPAVFTAAALAGDLSTTETTGAAGEGVHRYLIERTFPAGALDGLDDEAKARVNANNESVGVRWVKSFANSDKTKTYCVYEAPSESAVREAAALNELPVDRVTEIPVDLAP